MAFALDGLYCVCVFGHVSSVFATLLRFTSKKTKDLTELEASSEMTDRHSGSSFR